MSNWQLRVLGTASLLGEGKTLHLERKTVALLTYLGLEGATPRSKIAGLLWPDSGESTARSNLRQLLSRLKKTTGAELVNANELLSLQSLEVDAAKLKVLAFAEHLDEVLTLSGDLLSPHDYDDCPEFADWLFAERERIQGIKRDALSSTVQRKEKEANYSEALRHAESLLALEPLSEDSHRQIMRLHYLAGDRAAALAAFERCKSILEKELSIEPLPETLALVAEIEFGALLPTAIPKTQKPDLPLRVLRPPLVGRKEAWQRMEEAWQRQQLIFLSGVAGVGKSRLIQEFLATKQSKSGWFAGRLGDMPVPYATITRSFRQVLAEFPVTLGPWVKREFSRILPELGETPEAMTSENDLLRFYEAQTNVLALARDAGMQTVILEDAHHIDPASLQAVLHSGPNHWGKPGGLKMIVSFRPDELRPDEAFAVTTINDLVASGLAVIVELQPLAEEQVKELVDSLGVSNLADSAEQLSRYTGGNPLFIIETIKHLIESGKLSDTQPKAKLALPSSGKVFALLKERLSRLPNEAQRLVWTAAIGQSDFSVELASSILAKSPFDLAESFAELETANIFVHNKFSHDLLFETALRMIPSPIKLYIHRKCAEVLEKTRANPAAIAEHWLAVGDEERATPHLFEAAQQAKKILRLYDAIELLECVAKNLEKQGQAERALKVWFEFIEILETLEITKRLEQAILHSLELAKTPEDFATAYFFQSEYLNRTDQAVQGEAAARKGFEYALYIEEKYRPRLLSVLAESLWYQGRGLEAIEVIKQALPIAERLKSYSDLGSMYANTGVFYDVLEQHREATTYHQKALDFFKQQDNQVQQVTVLVNLAISQAELGLVKESLQALLETEKLYAALPSKVRVDQLYSTLASVHIDLCDYSSAKHYLAMSLELTGTEFMQKVSSYSSLARVFACLGDYETATKYFDQAVEGFSTFPSMQAKTLVRLAEARYLQNSSPAKLIARVEKLLQKNDRVLARTMLLLLQATVKKPKDALTYAKQALDMTKTYDLCGLQIAAESKCSQVHFGLRQFKQALEHTENALELLETYDVNDVYYGDVLLSNYQTLTTVKDKRAKAYLEQTYTWLMDIANNNVPPEYRESFLNNNPTNKAILETAKASGLPEKNLV
jgi:DNA-binding SARP family transcriptional activator